MTWTKEKLKAHYLKRQLWLLQYLEQHPCVDCGETDILVLEFDHLTQRQFTISEMIMLSMVRIMKEINRCEVVCANCHSKRTHKRANTFRWQHATGH